MNGIEERLAAIEARLARLEQSTAPSTVGVKVAAAAGDRAKPAQPATFTLHDLLGERAAKPRGEALSVTNVLGWTGATAMVLAAAYLIRLAIDSGWLTPERQIVAAMLSGMVLIGAGLGLRNSDRQYASLLPAGGLVILFLSIYGAHLHFQLIGAHAAVAAVVVVCLGALWLGRLFDSELYALFAAVGSYSAPFLLPILSGAVADLVIYFSAWGVLFCIASVWLGTRRVYLLAAYLALLGFNALREGMPAEEWGAVLAFQSAQFVIFLVGAVVYSIRRNSPMERDAALAHLPLLLIFYALQYALLQRHLPALAPWIALASAAVLLAAYGVARHFLQAPLESGTLLVGTYATLALFHAGYLESVPAAWAPWVPLLLLPILAGYLFATGKNDGVIWPLRLGIVAIFLINYLRVLGNVDLAHVPGRDLLGLIYAAQLYTGYYLARRLSALAAWAPPLLYAGHIALMGAALHILDERLAVSLSWGVLGIACLVLALRAPDKTLGKSSLLVFAASASKVLLFDLSGAAPLVRIACLLVLGVTLYGGGWMYRKLDALPD